MENVSIQMVKGGFIVTYPVAQDESIRYTTEVVTSVGKAMRIARAAVEEFSLVSKDRAETEG